jgi:hypothetical protein
MIGMGDVLREEVLSSISLEKKIGHILARGQYLNTQDIIEI